MSRKMLFAFLLISAGCMSLTAQQKFELADLARLTGLSDPQISPDGKSIVLLVSRPEYIIEEVLV